jgi:type IV secretion system protein VirB1
MKRLFLICALCLASRANAQDADIVALRSRCIPGAPLTTLRAIIRAESNGNPNAMQIDFPSRTVRHWRLPKGTVRLRRQPQTRQDALDWLWYFDRLDVSVDLGLMQVSTVEAKRRGIPAESLLDPCTNLEVGWTILEDDYRIEVSTYGAGQEALHHAMSRYNTGDSQLGITNGYLGRVLSAVNTLTARAAAEKR